MCVSVCGGGVLAGVEQSCNEQILERERERERPKNKRGQMTWWNWDTTTIQIFRRALKRIGQREKERNNSSLLLHILISRRGSSLHHSRGGRGDIHSPLCLSRCVCEAEAVWMCVSEPCFQAMLYRAPTSLIF